MAVPYSQMKNEMVLDPTVTLSALKVYQVIYTNTLNRAGWDFSYTQLAEAAGIGRTSAIAAVKWLEDGGWIVKMHSGGIRNPNLYAISAPVAQPTASDATGAVERTTTGAVDRSHQEKVTRKEELPPAPSSPSVPQERAPRKPTTLMTMAWEPDQPTTQWTKDNYPQYRHRDHLNAFRVYWEGKGARKADWNLAWRNWCVNQAKFDAR